MRAQIFLRTLLLCAGAAALLIAALLIIHFIHPAVVVTDVVDAPIVQAFYATGTVSPQREFDLRSAVSGIVQIQPGIDKGDHLTAGQVVAIVSDPERQLRLDKASAELDEAEKMVDEHTSPALLELQDQRQAILNQLKTAQDGEQQFAELFKKNAASRQDWDKSRDKVQVLTSDAATLEHQATAKVIDLQEQLKVAQANVSAARALLDQEQVRAPIDGIVLDRPASTGTRLADNAHILQMADLRQENLVMRAQVDEEDRNSLVDPTSAAPDARQQVEMTLYAFPGHVPFHGRVVRISPQADPAPRTYEVDVRMDDQSIQLAAGMTGELAFIVSHADHALVVPRQAVQDGKLWLLQGSQVRRLDAKVGLSNVERAQIIEGVKVGDRVVISPSANLSDGQNARVQYLDPLTAAGINKPQISDQGSHFAF